MKTDLISALKASGLTVADEAAEALANGWSVSSAWNNEAICAGLGRIYGKRYQQLLSRSGEHSALLASGISELLTNLQTHSDLKAYSFTIRRAAGDPSYLVVILAGSEKLVGCVRILKNWEPI